jgi:hypothetical protein
MKNKINRALLFMVIPLAIVSISGCSKKNNNSNNNNSMSNNPASLSYSGALVGSTGYLDLHLKGSTLGGSNTSYILVTYVDSSKTPVYTIKDSLTTSSLNNWQPGTIISNVKFAGSSGIVVTLITIDADGSNPVTKMQVPNDPYVKVFIEKETVSNSPLLVFIGKATSVGNGISGAGGSCNCYTKTINFVINPAYVGNASAAANAIYIDTFSHLAGFLNAQILSSDPNTLTQIINNNDTAGLHVNNGPGGPNGNNGSGAINGNIKISADGLSLSGAISGMYNPNSGVQASSCSCSYNVFAKKVQ